MEEGIINAVWDFCECVWCCPECGESWYQQDACEKEITCCGKTYLVKGF